MTTLSHSEVLPLAGAEVLSATVVDYSVTNLVKASFMFRDSNQWRWL
jgi:hypothetical protein